MNAEYIINTLNSAYRDLHFNKRNDQDFDVASKTFQEFLRFENGKVTTQNLFLGGSLDATETHIENMKSIARLGDSIQRLVTMIQEAEAKQ